MGIYLSSLPLPCSTGPHCKWEQHHYTLWPQPWLQWGPGELGYMWEKSGRDFIRESPV